MRKLDFYGLSRTIQDRFLESSQGAAAPAPLAVTPLKDWTSLRWGVGSLVSLAAWSMFVAYGLGDLSNPLALSSPITRAIHVSFATLVAYSALRSYALSWASDRRQYALGVYLFPSGAVEATDSGLVEYDAADMSSAVAEEKAVVVKYGESSFRFVVSSPEAAQSLAARVTEYANKWSNAPKSSALERARLNPLVDSGIPNPLAPTQPHSQPRLVNGALIWTLALMVGLGSGFGVSVWRDTLSQKALFKAAVAEHSVAGYRAYIERGGNRSEVVNLLLPRAELALAIEEGSVGAIERFLSANPETQISGEVQNALRAALLGELEKAKKLGTLAALGKVRKSDEPHRLIQSELAAARSAVFAQALADFQSRASKADPDLIPFVRELLAYAEANGPEVVVRVRQEFPQDPRMLDKIISKSRKYYMGRKSLPTQYFLGDQAREREKRLATAIVEGLQAGFPEEILSFRLAPLPLEANQELPVIETPTITLLHREKLSGGYVGGRPKAMYMGLALYMSATAELPKREEPKLVYRYNAWRNPDFEVLSDPDKDVPDVYEKMINVPFETFQEQYLSRWFTLAKAPQ